MKKHTTMDYLQAKNRYDLDKFISKIKNLNLSEIISSLNQEISSVEHAKIIFKPEYKRDIEYVQISYVSNLKGFGFLIAQSMRPAGVDKAILNKFKPVLLSLIEKKQMNEGILELIE